MPNLLRNKQATNKRFPGFYLLRLSLLLVETKYGFNVPFSNLIRPIPVFRYNWGILKVVFIHII